MLVASMVLVYLIVRDWWVKMIVLDFPVVRDTGGAPAVLDVSFFS
jgi:hypothetical protein